MLAGFLTVRSGRGGGRRLPLGASAILGRAMDCAIIIDDEAASRHHVEIVACDDRFRWRDLGSMNGTLCNGQRIDEGLLVHGDVLQIGDTTLTFEVEDVQEDEGVERPTTHFKEALMDWDSPDSTTARDGAPEGLLRAVYAVINEISSNYEPCTLVDRILETTVKAIHAQRGALFFAEPAAEGLQPCPVCGKFHVIEEGELRHLEQGDIRISGTVTGRVLARGESLLYQDTDSDTELQEADSVLSLDLRSIICVPVRGKSGVLGILYIDTNRRGHQYTHEHMLLTTAVGNSAGLAIENAMMHIDILEKQRMEQDIQHAWTIQQGLLVKQWPEDNELFSVYGETQPAKTVGGDFYDFVQLDPNRAGIFIGDVRGKGMPAALTMAQLLADFRLSARRDLPPSHVLRTLNEDLYARGQRGTFCTMCYLTLELDTGKVICGNAGHHPALCINERGVRVFGGATGPPAGVIPEGPWRDVELEVAPGDTILLYTDGIVEAREHAIRENGGRGPVEFGMERMCQVAHEEHESRPAELIARLCEEVQTYCKPGVPHDDCTMIALRYVGGPARVSAAIGAGRTPERTRLKTEDMRIEVSSDPKLLRAIRGLVQGYISRFGLSSDRVADAVLAVNEAYSNSIRHSYGNEPSGRVELVFRSSHDEIEVELRDEGIPSTRERLARISLAPPELSSLKPGGLGVQFIYQVFDETEYHPGQEQGNRVVMRLHLPDGNRPAAP